MKNTQAIETMATVYAKTNSASHVFFAKPMRGTWYGFLAPLTPDVIAALVSTIETSDEGAKMRFRPSNGAFYRAAKLNDSVVFPLATVEYVDNRVVELTVETGSRVNRGNVIEEIVADTQGDTWSYNPLQRAYYDVPDVIGRNGEWIQVKAYGASVTEKDLQDALKALKARR